MSLLENKDIFKQHGIIQASAGTGKTYTIEHLYIRLIIENFVPLNKILILTYTKKASNEIYERIIKQLYTIQETKEFLSKTLENKQLMFINEQISLNINQINAYTFHSFAQNIFTNYPLETEYNEGTKLIDISNSIIDYFLSIIFLKPENYLLRFYKVLGNYKPNNFKSEFRLQRSTSIIYSNNTLPFIEKEYQLIKNNNIDDSEEKNLKKLIKTKSHSFQELIFYQLNKMIDEYLRKNNAIDFSSMIHKLYFSLTNGNQLKEKLQEEYEIAFIDEFQDTNQLQWGIIESIFLNKEKKLFVVGDEKQSIFSFQGSDLEVYEKSIKKMIKHGAELYFLNTNYRSNSTLVDAYNYIFQQEEFFSKKYSPITAIKTEGKEIEPIVICELKNDYIEFIINNIVSLIQKGVKPNDIAILYQKKDANNHKVVQDALRNNSINYSYHKQPIFANYAGFHIIYLLYNLQLDRIDKGIWLTSIIESNSLSDVLEENFSPSDKQINIFNKLKNYANNLQWNDFFNTILFETEIAIGLNKLNRKVHYNNLSIICKELVNIANTEKLSLFNLIHRVEKLVLENEKKEIITSDGVTIITMHSSKGLEYKYTFILPKKKKIKTEKELFECKRLYYVALTRASTQIFLPHSEYKDNPDFLDSSLGSYIKLIPNSIQRSLNIEKKLDNKKENIKRKYKKLEADKIKLKYKRGSFSSLYNHKKKYKISPSPIEIYDFYQKKYDDIDNIQEEYYLSGAQLGNIYHYILENIEYSTAKQNLKSFTLEHIDIFKSALKNYNQEDNISQKEFYEIMSNIWNSLNTLLPNINKKICDLDKSKLLKEVEFSYKYEDTLIKGFIDLIFEYNNELYILDWKSNNLNNYDQESLTKSMINNDYNKQLDIYLQCLQELPSNLNKKVAGAYYLYLRGTRVKEQGIYFQEIKK